MQIFSVLNLVFKLIIMTVKYNLDTTEFTAVGCRFKPVLVILLVNYSSLLFF